MINSRQRRRGLLKMETLLVVLFGLGLSTETVLAYDTNSLKTRIITNWRANPNRAYETQTGVSLMIHCVVKCASNPNCTAIDHYEDTCLYFTGDFLVVEDGTAAGHTLVYVRDMFIFNAANTYASYTLTFSEAQQACSSLGGRLATYTEMETLYDTGFQFCVCSFINTGDTVLVMQEIINGCGNQIGIRYCGSSIAAAWCKT